MTNFSEIVQSEAAAMAEAINGGKWNTDYTEAQKVGWCRKVQWAMTRYAGLPIDDIRLMYGDHHHLETKLPMGILGDWSKG